MNEHCLRRFKVPKAIEVSANLSIKRSTYGRILQYLAATCDQRTVFQVIMDNSPLQLDYPSHDQAVEKHVKVVTEASGNW